MPSPVLPGGVDSAHFLVNSLSDLNDAEALANHVVTLRSAIEEADAAGGPAVIQLPAGQFSLDPGLGALTITDSISLLGAGSSATVVDGSGLNDRVFDIQAAAPGTTVSMSDLAITGGQVVDDDPGGGGGAILSAGASLDLTRVVMTGDQAAGANGARGGAINFSVSAGTQPLGAELWSSDGTASGTALIRDIQPGPTGSTPRYLTNVGGTLFFTADDGNSGRELWASDGTGSGTHLVRDIYPGGGSSNPKYLTNVNGTLFFQANDEPSGFFGANRFGNELWASDGTSAGTHLVRDINPQGNSYPRDLTNVSGTLFFSASDGSHGTELWESDGTSSGTRLVRDIYPGGSGSNPTDLTNVSGTLFFSANDGSSTGRELWASDGSASGTRLVADINFGAFSSSNPKDLTNVGGTLFFTATDGNSGYELWASDGTSAGTRLVRDISPGYGGSDPQNLTNVSGTLFFTANDQLHGVELWASDGTSVGTRLVDDIRPGADPSNGLAYSSNPAYLTNVGGTLFFSANDGSHGYELWRSDGTASGTVLVSDVYPGGGSSYPYALTNVNGTLFFNANDGSHGYELFRSDGTSSGTVLVKDVYPGGHSSDPAFLANANGTLFFEANGPPSLTGPVPTLTLTDCTITGSAAVGFSTPRDGPPLPALPTSGGAVFSDGPVRMVNTVIRGASADQGGAIDFEPSADLPAGSAALSITGGSLNGNTAGQGGAIFTSGVVRITGTTLDGNSADTKGGAIDAEPQGLDPATVVLSLTDATVANNTSNGSGGAVYATGGVQITGGTLADNTANADGGALFSSADPVISDATISGNTATRGGGIFSSGIDLTLLRDTFSKNQAVKGGGVYFDVGTNTPTLAVTDTQFLDNSASGGGSQGGGLYTNGPTTISGSTWSGNSAAEGGGIATFGGDLSVTDSQLTGNTAGQGGALAAETASVELLRTTVDGNFAQTAPNSTTARGAGVYYVAKGAAPSVSHVVSGSSPQLTVLDSTLSRNSVTTSPGQGGGLFADGDARVVDSTISGNQADRGGGVFVSANGQLRLLNATVADNTAVAGAGIADATAGGGVTLANTLLADNTATGGGGNYAAAPGVLPTSLGGNLDTDGSAGLSGPGDQSGVAALLAPLGNYGGPTQTQALLAASPAINAGSDALNTATVDQRGDPRVVGPHVDVGAYEAGVVFRDVSSSLPDATYTPGAVIDIEVTFTAPVVVNTAGGVPTLQVNTTPGEQATYVSGSGTSVLRFLYTVQTGDESPRLDYVTANALQLNGATFTDLHGVSVDPTLPTPGLVETLGAVQHLVVHTPLTPTPVPVPVPVPPPIPIPTPTPVPVPVPVPVPTPTPTPTPTPVPTPVGGGSTPTPVVLQAPPDPAPAILTQSADPAVQPRALAVSLAAPANALTDAVFTLAGVPSVFGQVAPALVLVGGDASAALVATGTFALPGPGAAIGLARQEVVTPPTSGSQGSLPLTLRLGGYGDVRTGPGVERPPLGGGDSGSGDLEGVEAVQPAGKAAQLGSSSLDGDDSVRLFASLLPQLTVTVPPVQPVAIEAVAEVEPSGDAEPAVPPSPRGRLLKLAGAAAAVAAGVAGWWHLRRRRGRGAAAVPPA